MGDFPDKKSWAFVEWAGINQVRGTCMCVWVCTCICCARALRVHMCVHSVHTWIYACMCIRSPVCDAYLHVCAGTCMYSCTDVWVLGGCIFWAEVTEWERSLTYIFENLNTEPEPEENVPQGEAGGIGRARSLCLASHVKDVDLFRLRDPYN